MKFQIKRKNHAYFGGLSLGRAHEEEGFIPFIMYYSKL